MLVSEKISGWGTAVRTSSYKKYLLLFLAITLTLGIFLSIPKEAFGIGFPNKATANSDNGVYHAKGKEHRLQVVVPGGATAEDWSFCINEGKGTPVYTPPPNEYSYGDFTRIDNATADQLYNEYGRNHANNGALAFHQLPNNVTKDQFYSQIRKLIYIFSQDPTNIIEKSGLKDLGNLAENGFWNVIQKIIYEYTEGKTYTENSFANAPQKKAFTQVKELIQKDEKDIIPDHTVIQIRVYKAEPIGGSWTKGVQSLVTGRILPKYPVYFSKQIFKAGITQDELIANATGEKGLSGAKFHIKDSNDKELVFDNGQVLEWTSNKDPQGVLIDPGKYSLVEVEAPQGYEPLDDIHFTLNHDGTISLEESDRVKKISYQGDVINEEGKATGEKETRQGLAVLNKKIEENSYQVKIAKVHQVGTEIQARTDARLELLKDGQHLDYWNTVSAPTRFNLKEGTYTIKEVRAPYGYKKLESEIQFTVGPQGKVTVTKGNDVASVSENSTIRVMNKKEPTIGTSAHIQQRGTDIGKEFTYATATQTGSLAVRDRVSYSGFEDGAYVAIAELIKGHDDTKVVASAFSPFEVKEGKDTGSADVFIPLKTDDISVGQNAFTVLERVYKAQDVEYEGADGATPVAKVKEHAQPVAVHVEKDDQDQTVTIKVVETKFVVNFWKTDQDGNKLPGARLKITDKNGKDLSGKIWTSLKDRATPVTLPAGEYILKEVAAPEGYSTLVDKTFTIDAQGTLTFDDLAGIKVETDADKDIFTVYVENKKKHVSPKGKLATTVSVGGVKASVGGGVRVTSAQAGAGVDVADTIAYTGLVAGEAYSVSGSLFEVADGRTVGDAIVTKTEQFTASDSGAGEWTVEFGRVAGLEPGKQYVVFEVATSVKDLVDTDGDDVPDAAQVEKHEDPNDASQTVVVEETPKKPSMPNTGATGIGALLGAALFACLAGAGMRLSARRRSKVALS